VLYTIETRELTRAESRHLQVEANDHDDAIHRYVADTESELLSHSRPGRGVESIATVRKADSVFLVRVYEG